jgi:hypothetical protein
MVPRQQPGRSHGLPDHRGAEGDEGLPHRLGELTAPGRRAPAGNPIRRTPGHARPALGPTRAPPRPWRARGRPAHPRPLMRLRVLTVNVQHDAGDPRRTGLLNRELRRLAPDLVAFQEVCYPDRWHQLAELVGPQRRPRGGEHPVPERPADPERAQRALPRRLGGGRAPPADRLYVRRVGPRPPAGTDTDHVRPAGRRPSGRGRLARRPRRRAGRPRLRLTLAGPATILGTWPSGSTSCTPRGTTSPPP